MTIDYLEAGLPTFPHPTIDPETLPYWSAAGEGRLVLPFCRDCRQFFWYPRGFCPRCTGSAIEWHDSTGQGTVYSFTVVRRAFGAWRERAPFVVALISLEEGITLSANIVACPLSSVGVGALVRPVFEQADSADPAILRFTPR